MTAERTGEASTLDQVDFEPWEKRPCPLPTNEEWATLANPYLVTLRLCWVIVQKTKPEVIEVARSLAGNEKAFTSMMDAFEETATFFRGAMALLEQGEGRFLVAASAVLSQADGGR